MIVLDWTWKEPLKKGIHGTRVRCCWQYVLTGSDHSLARFKLQVLMLGLCTAPLIFWNHALLSKLKPAVPGAHITVQVIYTVWSEDGMKGALVYGMLVTNRV